jgi:hypothetical protein
MPKIYSKVRIMLMTFALGLGSVNFFNWYFINKDEIAVNLPKTQSASVFEVITKRNWKGFESVGVGCGGRNIYGGESTAAGYRTNDLRSITVSTSSYDSKKEIKAEINQRIKNAIKVLESAEKSGRQKIILENEENDKKWVDIIEYNGGNYAEIISAPTLELAFEFEELQKLKDKEVK